MLASVTRRAWPVAVATLAVVLAGCGSRVEASQGQPWVEPAWMSALRLELEEYQAAALACFAGYGVNAQVSIGGAVIMWGVLDEDGLEPAEMRALESLALASCDEQVPFPATWESSRDLAAFERQLDVRNCLAYHGVETAEPPSPEVWLEQEAAWSPYLDDNVLALSIEDRRELLNLCPQSGHGLVIIADPNYFPDP